jgi:precorrin-6A synthase
VRKLLLIGIGAGDPSLITQQAIAALNQVEVFFLIDKGESTDELLAIRHEICERFIEGDQYRFVEIAEPPRDRQPDGYEGAVQDWLSRRAELFAEAITGELADDGTGAFLVWGDPTLYDGTIRIIDALTAAGRIEVEFEVIPGISSVQVLLARHRLPMNRIGEPIHITTGRRLAQGVPDGLDNIIVMLDAGFAALTLPHPEHVDVYWGAYLGTPDESLISGRLSDVGELIAARKAELRAAKGWIMDTYLLRRTH